MALLGCLSLVQVLFLPGWIILRLVRLPATRLQSLVLSFGLSLVFNQFLVIGLVAIGCYCPSAMYLSLAAEIVAALILSRDLLARPLAMNDLGLYFQHWMLSFKSWKPMPGVAVLAAGTVIALYAVCGLWQAGDIFRQWDAVVSWNRWAIDWARNDWPQTTSLYPQLLPINISITYVFLQSSEIWCFAKGFQFLFCLLTLIAIFDLGLSRRSPGIVAGVVITYILCLAVLRYRMLASGYADMPVAFFTFASLAMLLHASDSAAVATRRQFVIVGCLLVIGAALTKQVGLYVAGIYPFLAWRMVYARHDNRQHAWPKLLRLSLTIVLFVAPWYGLKKFEVSQGHDHDNTLSLIKGYQQERTVPQRFIYGLESASEVLTPVGVAGIALLLAISLADRDLRLIVLVLIVPWGWIWSLGFSYDMRNLAMVLPWAAVACGVAFERLLPNFIMPPLISPAATSFAPKRFYATIAHALLAIVAVTLFCSRRISDETLRAAQIRQQREIGIPDVDGLLYEYDRRHGIRGLVATDYLAMPWLPDLASHRLTCSPHNLASLRSVYERPDVRYALLCREGASPEVWIYLQQSSGDAQSVMVFETKLYRFFAKTGISAPNVQSVTQTNK